MDFYSFLSGFNLSIYSSQLVLPSSIPQNVVFVLWSLCTGEPLSQNDSWVNKWLFAAGLFSWQISGGFFSPSDIRIAGRGVLVLFSLAYSFNFPVQNQLLNEWEKSIYPVCEVVFELEFWYVCVSLTADRCAVFGTKFLFS